MTMLMHGNRSKFSPAPVWIFALAAAIFCAALAGVQAQTRRSFDPAQFDCSSGPGTTPWPLHMATFVAQEAHYCAWDLDKLSFSSVGQPIRVTQQIDNYVIYQDVTWNPLTRCDWKCHAPFAARADPKHPAKRGQTIAEGTYRIIGITAFAESDGAAIEVPVVAPAAPGTSQTGLTP